MSDPVTPEMSLVLPVDHADTDAWGVLLNDNMELIDGHDHTAGKGIQVPSAGININADIAFASGGNSYALTALKAVAFEPIDHTTVASYAGAFYVDESDNNLYYRTIAGTDVKVTDGNALNVSQFTGGIGGDYGSAAALVSYVDSSKNYLLQQEVVSSVRDWAGLQTADVSLYQKNTTAIQAVTLKSPNSLASGYSIVFPAALPGSTLPLQLDSSGNITASATFSSNTSLAVTGSGYYKRASSLTRVIPMSNGTAYTISGSNCSNQSWGGIGLTSSSQVAFPLFGVTAEEQIVNIKVLVSSLTGGTATGGVELLLETGSTSSASAVTALSAGTTTIAGTLTGPMAGVPWFVLTTNASAVIAVGVLIVNTIIP